MTPQRIQLSRKAGWRLREGARSVARPHKYGNPAVIGRWASVGGAWEPGRRRLTMSTVLRTPQDAVAYYALAVNYGGMLVVRKGADASEWVSVPSIDEIRDDLVGHDLACWCPVGQPCHADLLLAVANGVKP